MSELSRRAIRDPEFLARFQLLTSAQPVVDGQDAVRWLRRFFVYRSEYREVVRTPQFMLSEIETRGFMEGDCDCISTLTAAVFGLLEIPSRFVAIRYTPGVEYFEHVFTEVLDGMAQWRIIDITVPEGTVIHATARMIEEV